MYKVVSHTADVALEVRAGNLESLFAEAAEGWKHIVVEDSPTKPAQVRRVALFSFETEDLLIQWLSELNYFLTVHQWVLHKAERVKLESSENEWRLEAEISGEFLDADRHYIYCDIKAVTYHQLNIRKAGGQFFTKIIFDL